MTRLTRKIQNAQWGKAVLWCKPDATIYGKRSDNLAAISGTTKPALRSIEEADNRLSAKTFWLFFAGIFVLNLLLRVFYLRYDFVNGDESVRALTATGLLDGARLYVDIVTDKPPGTTFFYATVFALFGRHMAAVHLAAAVWNFFTSIIIYLTAKRIYGRRVGLWAALLFVYFSTNYFTQDMMAANTEMLMALPYTASFYLFLRAADPKMRRRGLDLFLAGLLTGLAVTFKQLGVFNLGCFALAELLMIYAARKEGQMAAALLASSKRLALVALGVVVVLALLASWLAATGAIADFWRNVVVLNTFYIRSLPTDLWLQYMIGRTLGYVFFNLTLWSLAGWTIWRAMKRRRESLTPQPQTLKAEWLVALWGLVSLAGVFTGGRFFGHYFIQVLPPLAILGASGLADLLEGLKTPARKRRNTVALGLLALLFAIGLARSHGRTLILAYETLAGRRTAYSEDWGMTRREREAEIVAQRVRQRIQAGEPLYIWDYALDVYWRSQCRPASRYLTPYYITGDFTDSNTRVADMTTGVWPVVRGHLIDDLKRRRPRIILDMSNTLMSLPYAEITDFINEHYQRDGEIGVEPGRPFVVYTLKD
jgi:4-amino-4-deoxy-L-arabinose transferase-like glycosyltransferase